MKVFLLGKSGMLGSCFLKHLAGNEDFEMYAVDRNELDITSFSQIETIFDRVSPDFVINCAGHTAVDNCESDKDMAFTVNARAPGVLAKVCKRENAVLLHFSTDYVFDGENPRGYAEDDEPSPINVYGSSKLEGEQLIEKNTDGYYIIRTSWLFGDNGKNFVDTMIKLRRKDQKLNVVGDQVGSPTYTTDLVEAVIEYFLNPYLVGVPRIHELSMLNRIKKPGEKPPFGIYHLTNSGTCSRYEFAGKIFEFMKLDVDMNKVGSADFPRPAKRPRCSILRNTKLKKLRPWENALKAYLELHY